MKTFGFGQKAGQIVQTAYVVKDIRAAIDWWVKDGKAGRSSCSTVSPAPNSANRGEPTQADVAIAMGFAGHMMIELIQPRDDRPSVYRETIRARGHGFHHLGIAFEDVEAARSEYHGRGYHVAFSAPVPSGGTVYYMGDGPDAPGFIELIPATQGMDEMFTKYWKASVDWDGRNPVRPFG